MQRPPREHSRLWTSDLTPCSAHRRASAASWPHVAGPTDRAHSGSFPVAAALTPTKEAADALRFQTCRAAPVPPLWFPWPAELLDKLRFFNNRVDFASLSINTFTHFGTKNAQKGGFYLNPNMLLLSLQDLRHIHPLEHVQITL